MTTTNGATRVELAAIRVRNRQARVACGGDGTPVLLLHGGWGGATMHWSRVWNELAASHRVVAPDLPGLGAVDEAAFGSVAGYARWLVELLDALAIDRVVCVGSSFGASVAWSLAGRFPERVSGLVMVDGFPMPETPKPLARLAELPGARKLGCALVSRLIYRESNLPRAFASVVNVPPELRRAIVDDWPLIVPRYVDILIAGDGAPAPRVVPHLVWGARDRLPGSSPRDAERWHRRLPGATLTMIQDAGHFPQLEAPEAFLRAIGELGFGGVEARPATTAL